MDIEFLESAVWHYVSDNESKIENLLGIDFDFIREYADESTVEQFKLDIADSFQSRVEKYMENNNISCDELNLDDEWAEYIFDKVLHDVENSFLPEEVYAEWFMSLENYYSQLINPQKYITREAFLERISNEKGIDCLKLSDDERNYLYDEFCSHFKYEIINDAINQNPHSIEGKEYWELEIDAYIDNAFDSFESTIDVDSVIKTIEDMQSNKRNKEIER